MKKLLIGILVLIPVIILGVVTLAANIASIVAHIGVESVSIAVRDEYDQNDSMVLPFSDVADKTINLNDYINIEVLPTRATNPTIEWSIANLHILDQEYEQSYNYYKNHIDDEGVAVVLPPVMLVDNDNNELSTNTTGKIKINTYCSFEIKAMAENQQDLQNVLVVGYDVERLVLSASKSVLKVGDLLKISTNYTPIDSIVTKLEWSTSNDEIATVDKNGIVKAKKDGTCKIICKAYKKTNPNQFVESQYDLTIQKSSTVFGNLVYTHLNTIPLSMLGITNCVVMEGASLSGGELTLSSNNAKIKVNDEEVTICKCNENQLEIDQLSVLDYSCGYVAPISSMPIDLSVSFLSDLKEKIVNANWNSSNNNIAIVDNHGNVYTKSSGLVTITASFAGEEARIELNVQDKVNSLVLETNDSSLAVGIARETVFASMKYIDISHNNDKEENYIDILIKGEPKSGEESERSAFYCTYNFEILSGKEYAKFDSIINNRLVFLPNIEGKGKQSIKVKVSAKYPRYEAFPSYTTANITINAIYGVEVSTSSEFFQAALDQKTYAYSDGNLIVSKGNEQICTDPDFEAKISSKNILAICLASNITYPEDMDVTNNHPLIYGSIYGNNKMLSATNKQLTGKGGTIPLIKIVWSDVVVSNMNIRCGEINSSGVITSGDVEDLPGHCISLFAIEDQECVVRIQNINIEYCILENGRCALQAEAVDLSLKGCIVRNMSNVGMYFVYGIRKDETQEHIYILPCNIVMENMIFSNCLGTAFDLDTFMFEVDHKNKDRYVFGETKEESDKYIRENLVPKGLNGSFTQKGFLDIYNWTSTEDVSLVKTGEESLDQILKIASSTIIGTDASLADYRFRYKGLDYFHLGFMVESMDASNMGNQKAMRETVWMDISLEDTRFKVFDVATVQDETVAFLLKQMGIWIYAYQNDADLKPNSTYVINDYLISKLHG